MLGELRRFPCSRGNALAEEFDSRFQALALFPEASPEVAFLFKAGGDCLDVQGLGLEGGAQFVWQNRRGNGGFGKRSHGVSGSQRAAVSVLLNVNQDGSHRSFRDYSLAGYEIRVFSGYIAGNDFGKRSELIVGVDRLDRHKNVKARGTGRFQEMRDLQFVERFVKRLRDRDDRGKSRAVRWIEIEKKVIGMVEVVVAV
jgi:hypothetical protein